MPTNTNYTYTLIATGLVFFGALLAWILGNVVLPTWVAALIPVLLGVVHYFEQQYP